MANKITDNASFMIKFYVLKKSLFSSPSRDVIDPYIYLHFHLLSLRY